MKILELDIFFISYDEPNADLHYADLCNKVPWAKRVHGVKGSDACHKVCAEQSETDWFVSVDADNIVDPKFFNLDLDFTDPKIKVYGWCGRNKHNGLRYGNGGLKIWKKDFVLGMKTHEAADSDRAQVDFCWEDGYQNFPMSYSESIVTGSPFQAWRAGFREGVKMTLLDGVKVPPKEIEQRIWWHNVHRLKLWHTIGSHVENGDFCVYGARLGTYMANCTDWNYVDVRDFEILREIYNRDVKHFEKDTEALIASPKELARKNFVELGFDWPYLNAETSKFTYDLYNQTIELCRTYYRMSEDV
jgi:hypothetical protein